MPSSSPPPLERATPLFGTLVSVRVEGCGSEQAMAATSRAFTTMADIHGLMSFHEPGSELSLLNRVASRRTVRITQHMTRVLAEALAVAAAGDGVFDPTVAPLAVRAGCLPRPDDVPDPDPAADWRDIDLDPDAGTVWFRRPLWLDLGGVAKGYAVDAASAVLRAGGVSQGCINAGGDLSVFGPRPELVALDTGLTGPADRVVRLSNASLASSGDVGAGNASGRALAAHFDAPRRRRSPPRFVTVRAPRCVHADALTKVVLARGRAAHGALLAFGASAAACSTSQRWSTWGRPA